MVVRTLKHLGLGLFFVFVLATTSLYTRGGAGVGGRQHAQAATSSQLNFQARLQSATGNIVPDGVYSIQFKLYTASSGGVAEWTETNANVTLKGGYMSVYLGSLTGFPSTIDWSADHWVTMNVNSDGEMTPRIQLTSVPYAFRAGQADSLTNGSSTLTASNIAQLAPSSIQVINSALTLLQLNQTGSGALAQFQRNGVDSFTVAANGDLVSAGSATLKGGTLNLGTATQAGGLVLNDAAAHTGTIKTATLTGPQTYTLPDASGILCLTTTCAGSVNSFVQNGNSFTGLATLGTNDNFSLAFETNNVTRLTLDTSGNANLTGALTAGTGLIVSAGGAAITGTTSINNSGSAATSIGTGTNTGAITIGNGAVGNTFALASNGGLNVSTGGNITTPGTYNTNTFSGTQLTFGGASGNIATTSNGDLTLAPNGSGKLVLNTGSGGIITTNATTLQRSAAAFNIDLANAGLSTLNVGNSNGTNVANLDVSGGIFAGNGNAFSVNSSGDITSAFTQLDGASTTNGTSGLTPPSTSLTLVNATNFDVGNYVQINDTNCGGAAVNPCYAKITAKAGNVLTISPGLTWTSAKTVNEYHVPELGGIDTSQALANRYGRGYFISGVAAGNGTTYYNEDSITTSLSNFDFLTSLSGTLNIGTSAAAVNIGNSSGTTAIAGNVTFSGNVAAPATGTSGYLQRSGTNLSPANAGDTFTTSGNLITTGTGTITSAAGLVVQAGGLNLTSSGITNAGALSGISTIGLTGAITGATTVDTINGLIINSGALSGVSTINASGAITAATTGNTINGLIISSGAVSGATTINASGLVTSAGLTAGSGLVQGTGGLTITGTTSINSDTISSTQFAFGGATGTVTTTGNGDLTLVPNGSGKLVLNTGSGGLATTNITSLQRNGATGLTVDLLNAAGATTLLLTNSDVGAANVANLNLGDGALLTGGVNRLTNSGALQNITGFSANGVFANLGGAVSLNVASNFNTNINTGSSTGIITIGGGLAPLIIDSTNFNVSAAGDLSGITSLSASGLVTLSAGTSALSLTGLPVNTATTSLLRLGSVALVGGNTTANGGTYIGINTPAGGVGSAADFVNFQNNGTSKFKISSAGVISSNGSTGLTITACTAGQYIGNGAATVGGLVTAGSCRNDATGLSDVRLKKDINTVNSVLDKLGNVRVVTFNFKVDELPNMNLDHGLQYGVIAQELEQIFPELVSQREDGYKEVNFKGLSFYTLKAVTELSAKVDALNSTAASATTPNEITTDGILRLSHTGALQNITGLQLTAGGASVVGGLDNNGGGVSNAGVITGATLINAEQLSLKANATDNLLTLSKDDKGVFTIFNNGALQLQLDATNAFTVKDAAQNNVLNIDTKTGQVTVGTGKATDKTVLFVLDKKTTDGDPAGTNGAQYYNESAKKFRCYQNDKWQDCVSSGDISRAISSDQQKLHLTSDDQEYPGTPRIWINLDRANWYRLDTRITTPGDQGATCRLQYANSDDGPWSDLDPNHADGLSLSKTGTIKGEWSPIAKSAQAEILIRVICKGVSSANPNFVPAVPTLYGLSLTIR